MSRLHGPRSLRARLFIAIAATLAVSTVVMLAVGAALTRRSLDHDSRSALDRQVELIVAQHAANPLSDSETTLGRFLATEQESLAILTPAQAELLLPDEAAAKLRRTGQADGTVDIRGEPFMYAARLGSGDAIVLTRSARNQSADWQPFLVGLALAALIGAALAAFVAFLLSVSHELKTPLTAIRGYAEGLGEGAFEPGEAARVITTESGRLERLVRDLLDLARMNRSEFSVRSEGVDLAEIAREAARRHEPTARGLGVDLRAVAGEAWVTGDGDRILQIASNLVENALRATPAGGSVTVAAEGARLVVSDTGPGIPADDLPHAFERFYLYDKVGRDRLIGSGLGLAIVRQLATAMGGAVGVQSSAAGTTFTVTLGPHAGGVDDLEVGAVERTERV